MVGGEGRRGERLLSSKGGSGLRGIPLFFYLERALLSFVSATSNDRTAPGIFGMHDWYGHHTQDDVGSHSSRDTSRWF